VENRRARPDRFFIRREFIAAVGPQSALRRAAFPLSCSSRVVRSRNTQPPQGTSDRASRHQHGNECYDQRSRGIALDKPVVHLAPPFDDADPGHGERASRLSRGSITPAFANCIGELAANLCSP